jgi:hypothetical protein
MVGGLGRPIRYGYARGDNLELCSQKSHMSVRERDAEIEKLIVEFRKIGISSQCPDNDVPGVVKAEQQL